MSVDLPGSRWQAEDGLHIDLRGLVPPQPMVAVLAAIEQPGQTGPITAHLDREPIYLYPELTERGWHYRITGPAGAEVTLVLTKRP